MKKLVVLIMLIAVCATGTDRDVFDSWAAHYLDAAELQLPVYERTAIAITKMYRLGPEPGPYHGLTQKLLADPFTPFWGHCGSTVMLYRDIVSEYGYTVRTISHFWNATPQYVGGHVTAEVSGPGLEKPVFIDPGYGMWLVDSAGKNMGIEETMLALDVNDPAIAVRTVPYTAAVDPVYEVFNAASYDPDIYPRFWNGIHLRTENYTRHVLYVRDSARVDAAYLRTLLIDRPGRTMTTYFLDGQ